MRTIEIFRAGTHTAMSGEAMDFSEAILAAAAGAYDPTVHEAPLVVGHPSDTAPAYGWVKGLSAEAGSLRAACDQINPDFAELVRGGSFKKVSASFYKPDSAANPKPGAYYLRHVGFLGAQPPAIKGLAPVEFAGGDEDAVTVEFGEIDGRTVGGLFRSLRDFLIGQFGLEEADKALPSYQVEWLAEDAARVTPDTTPAFSETTPKPKEKSVVKPDAAEAERAEALKSQEANFAERQAKFAQEQAAFRRQSNTLFLDGLVAAGRPLPAEKDTLLSFMEAIGGDATTVDFGEGTTKPALDVFKDVLGAVAKQVNFAEIAPGDPNGDPTEDPLTLARDAVSYRETQAKAGVVISTTEAVAHVRKERKL